MNSILYAFFFNDIFSYFLNTKLYLWLGSSQTNRQTPTEPRTRSLCSNRLFHIRSIHLKLIYLINVDQIWTIALKKIIQTSESVGVEFGSASYRALSDVVADYQMTPFGLIVKQIAYAMRASKDKIVALRFILHGHVSTQIDLVPVGFNRI